MAQQNKLLRMQFADITIQFSNKDNVYTVSDGNITVPVALENYCMLQAPTEYTALQLWQKAYRVFKSFRETIQDQPLSC